MSSATPSTLTLALLGHDTTTPRIRDLVQTNGLSRTSAPTCFYEQSASCMHSSCRGRCPRLCRARRHSLCLVATSRTPLIRDFVRTPRTVYAHLFCHPEERNQARRRISQNASGVLGGMYAPNLFKMLHVRKRVLCKHIMPEILLGSRLALLRSSTALRFAQDDTGGESMQASCAVVCRYASL